ncbi:arylesterase [Psychrobacter lutiphocae]|uniref:arylesterase n=1 Tax=Psychrobacter lutiphocae TaxID=540500 RepID=UPI00035D319A|nr:arylesterase [Psychrobacter lutiphocae]
MSLAFLKPLTALVVASALLIACQPSSNESTDTQATDNATTDLAQNTTTEQQPVQAENAEQDSTPEQVIEQPVTILALGDSLTEGLGLAEEDAYPAQLEKTLQQAGYVNAKVINSGLSGETSTGLVNRLDWVLKTKPDITILTIGANDAMRGIDVATVDSNIRTAIQRLQDEGSVVVLGGMQIYDNLGDEYVKSFSALYPKIVEDTGVAFIPFFLDGVGGVPELNQADAIHPTAEGYTQIVQNNILPVLKPTLAEFVDEQPTDSTQP